MIQILPLVFISASFRSSVCLSVTSVNRISQKPLKLWLRNFHPWKLSPKRTKSNILPAAQLWWEWNAVARQLLFQKPNYGVWSTSFNNVCVLHSNQPGYKPLDNIH